MRARRAIATAVIVGLLSVPGSGHSQEGGATADTQEEARKTAFEIQPDGTVGQSGMTMEELDAATAEVAGELRCLVCRGQSILESQVELAQDMRALTKELLAEGNTPDEVRGYFVARYGEYVLLRPTANGMNWIVYVFPFAGILIGAFILHSRMRRWAGPADEPADEAVSDVGEERAAGDAETDFEQTEFSEENERWLAEAIRGS